MKSQQAVNTRQAILKSAYQIVQEQGFTSLTLEAVAKHAGVSKGGLLYHFGSKDALIGGMITLISEIADKQIEEQYEQSSKDPGAFLRAYISLHKVEDYEKEMGPGMLAALASNPSLLDPLRADATQTQQRIENDGIDPVLATIIRLAFDSLIMSEFLQIGELDQDMRAAVIERLNDMTHIKKE
ncbi:TetR/AcrR family transcriptional regulator [Priestia flexa]|uniref:TetR/AcrR family transcriptional regulator n=1 Tax=Priestia flexa TaxID=86664 RepID=UPI001B3277AC|nr:TetR/AcrR family transcriptional regulator [Priestia flexa]